MAQAKPDRDADQALLHRGLGLPCDHGSQGQGVDGYPHLLLRWFPEAALVGRRTGARLLLWQAQA
jgi:hypothetical protein